MVSMYAENGKSYFQIFIEEIGIWERPNFEKMLFCRRRFIFNYLLFCLLVLDLGAIFVLIVENLPVENLGGKKLTF